MYILFYLLAVLTWGTDAAITKRFLLNSLEPAPMTALRLGVAALFLLPLAAREYPALRRFLPRDWLRLVVLILVGTLAMNLLFYEALTRTPAFITLILFRLEPVFVILIGAVFMGERTAPRTLLITAAAILSGALVSFGNASLSQLAGISIAGISLVLAASVCSAIGTILAKSLLAQISPLLLTSLRTLLASFCLLLWLGPGLVTTTLPAMPASDLRLVLVMGVIYSGVTFWMYYIGLQHTKPLVGSLIQLVRIISGLLASFFLLSETPTALQWAGTAGLMASLYYLTRPGSTISSNSLADANPVSVRQ